jgi:hypothetical protein
MAEDVHPPSIFLVPEIGPYDHASLGRTAFYLAVVGDLTHRDYTVAGRAVRNMVDLAMDRDQAGKEPFPSLAHFVATPMEIAIGRNKKDVVTAGKQGHHLFRVEQPVSFKKLMVKFLVCGDRLTRQSIRGLCRHDPCQEKRHQERHNKSLQWACQHQHSPS